MPQQHVVNTKFNIGQRVFYRRHASGTTEQPCTHCNGNYREIVNGIEYLCKHCNGGRETIRDSFETIEEGIIFNIIVRLGRSENNIKYSVGELESNRHYNEDEDNTMHSMREENLYNTKNEAEMAAIAEGYTLREV